MKYSRSLLAGLAVVSCLIGCTPQEVPGGGFVDPDGPDGPADETSSVYGTVSCEGVGLEGVAVSDGYVITTTDSEGRYALPSAKEHGYVFVSIPSGYEVRTDGILPQFYRYLTKDGKTCEKADFTLFKENQDKTVILMLGDLHLASRMHDFEQFADFTEEVSRMIAENPGTRFYGFTLGDMAWDIFWERYNLSDYVSTMNSSLRNLPVFHTIGNHDHEAGIEGDWYTATKFKHTLGPTYYSVNIAGIHIISLDDILCQNTTTERSFKKRIDDRQIEWLRKDLSLVSHDTPVFVTMHAPLYYSDGSTSLTNGFNGFISLFNGFDKVQVVSGHTHVVYNVDRLSSSVHVFENNSGAVCGAWWMTGNNVDVHLSGDGAPGGYRVFEVENNLYDWYFKGTGRKDDFQFRTYDRNCIELSAAKWCPNATASGRKAFEDAVGEYSKKSNDNYVLINVWDWDPEWEISVTENGKSLPVTALKNVKDPLYLVCYEAYEYENHFDDTVYYPANTTNHIFRVQASSASSTLEIKVRDRFGREYRETMKRPRQFSIKEYQ